jgi:excisionase family DNA binding protein
VDTYITGPEAARLLDVSDQTIIYMAKRGKLRARRIKGRRQYALSEVRTMAAIRSVRPLHAGRPSAKTLLRRRAIHAPKVAHILKELAEGHALEAART